MIGASSVNSKIILRELAKMCSPFHQPALSLGYLILVVTLAMEDRKMLMSS